MVASLALTLGGYLGQAITQDGVTRGVSCMVARHQERSSMDDYYERIKLAHSQLQFALERSGKLPITDVSLLRQRIFIKLAFQECDTLLRSLQPPVHDQQAQQMAIAEAEATATPPAAEATATQAAEVAATATEAAEVAATATEAAEVEATATEAAEAAATEAAEAAATATEAAAAAAATEAAEVAATATEAAEAAVLGEVAAAAQVLGKVAAAGEFLCSSLARSVSSALGITRDKQSLSAAVKKFEGYADFAGKFMRDVESGCSIAHYRFFSPLITQLLQGIALEYEMVQGTR